MRRSRCAKIIATLGPATSTLTRVAELFDAGADLFRLNFSHGSHDEHRTRYQLIRKLEEEAGRPIGILMDLQGPKFRIGRFADGPIKLIPGSPFRLDLMDEPGNSRRVTLPHPEIIEALTPGTMVLMDDGKLRLRVEKTGKDFVETIVSVGGELSDRKGVNIPDVIIPLSVLTEKDREDLEFGLELGIDWVALSFVQRPEDVTELQRLVDGRAKVMAKLEKPSAIDNLHGILKVSDAIMIARGDLGVEVPAEDVPGLQKWIIRECRKMGKPVVVATQMLDSMVRSPLPTRAEASDVATAVYDGVDAVMLYQETYHAQAYQQYHLKGKKADIKWRLDAPDRVGKAAIDKIGIGILLGLTDWRTDAMMLAQHLQYLQQRYWQSRFSLSVPRIRPCSSGNSVAFPISDKELIQLICAFRLFAPELEISLSTRESAAFRQHVVPLAITSISAGSKTQPGGYSVDPENLEQFSIDDNRSPKQVAKALAQQGLQPVWKDWEPYLGR